MRLSKKVISLLIAITLILSSLPFSVIRSAAATTGVTDSSLALRRPVASVYVTDVTRVAYSRYSMKQPSGSNSVI